MCLFYKSAVGLPGIGGTRRENSSATLKGNIPISEFLSSLTTDRRAIFESLCLRNQAKAFCDTDLETELFLIFSKANVFQESSDSEISNISSLTQQLISLYSHWQQFLPSSFYTDKVIAQYPFTFPHLFSFSQDKPCFP